MTDIRKLWMVGCVVLAASFLVAGCGSGGGTPPAGPSVLEVSPALGPKEGGTLITIKGTGFTADTTVTLAETPVANFTFVDENTITCETPAVAGGTRAGVIIRNALGVAFLLDVFFYIPAPDVLDVNPNFGKPEGLVPVTITGKGFVDFNAGANTVTFGGAPATNVVAVSDTSITCVIPPGSGPVDVAVTNNNGTGIRPNGYRYFPPPTVNRVVPDRGSSLGGTLVTVSGTGFTANNPGAAAVLFGGIPASNVTILNDTTLTCEVPPGAPGTVSCEVNNANGAGSIPAGFTYHPFPTLTAITPDSGPSDGGVPVTITGTGFVVNNAGLNNVRIDGQAVGNLVVVDDTTITCTTPMTPTGLVSIDLENANGTAQLVDAYRATLVALLGSLGGQLFRINTATAATTAIGTGIGFTLTGMAFHPNGTLYAITTTGQLITINTDTGIGTSVGTISPSLPPGAAGPAGQDLAFIGTRLFFTNHEGDTVEINTSTAAATARSSFSPGNWGHSRCGIGYIPSTGETYLTVLSDGSWYDIDVDTGSRITRSFGGSTHAICSLAYWQGTMYALNVQAGSGCFGGPCGTIELYTFNSTLTSTTRVGNVNADCIAGTP